MGKRQAHAASRPIRPRPNGQRRPQARHGLWHGPAAERPLDQVRRPVQAVGGLDARPEPAGPLAVGRVAQDGADRVAEAVNRQPPDRDRPAHARPLDPGPDPRLVVGHRQDDHGDAPRQRLEGRVQPAVRDRQGRPPDQLELRRVPDHDRVAGEVPEQRRVLPAAERDHQLQVQPRARLGDHPEGPEDPVLERPHRGVHQGPARVEAGPGEVHRRPPRRVRPGAGVVEVGRQAAARQLQGGGQLRDLGQPREQRVEVPGRGQPPGPALPVDRPQDPREDPLAGRVAHPVPEPGPDAGAVGPREVDGRDAGVEVDRQGGRHADERQAQVLGHGPARHLDLVDDEGIDALVADRGRGVPEEHHRLPSDSAKRAPQGGEALELTELLIPRAERAGGEVLPADLAELQARRPDRPLEVGDLEVDHFMAPRLEPPPQGRERIVVTRRGETQDADAMHGSILLSDSDHGLWISHPGAVTRLTLSDGRPRTTPSARPPRT